MGRQGCIEKKPQTEPVLVEKLVKMQNRAGALHDRLLALRGRIFEPAPSDADPECRGYAQRADRIVGTLANALGELDEIERWL